MSSSSDRAGQPAPQAPFDPLPLLVAELKLPSAGIAAVVKLS